MRRALHPAPAAVASLTRGSWRPGIGLLDSQMSATSSFSSRRVSSARSSWSVSTKTRWSTGSGAATTRSWPSTNVFSASCRAAYAIPPGASKHWAALRRAHAHPRVHGWLRARAQYVDHVILGAPYSVSEAFLAAVGRVDVVAHGPADAPADVDGNDPYAVREAVSASGTSARAPPRVLILRGGTEPKPPPSRLWSTLA